MDIKERIQEYLKHKGITPTAVERLLNWGVGSLTKVKSISADRAKEFLLFFPDLSSEWLMRGEGPMLRPDPSQSVGDISGSTVVGNNVHGSGNNITSHAELAALQGQYLEMLKKRDEQIDRLTAVIERLTAKL